MPDHRNRADAIALRLAIARSRQRIERQCRSIGAERRRLMSWRTYVQQFPVGAALAALGLGLTAGAAFTGRRMTRLAGLWLARRAWRSVQQGFMGEVGRFWNEILAQPVTSSAAPQTNDGTRRSADEDAVSRNRETSQ
ncbi:MAG: hypothetical protein ACOY3P_08015 [Planctomycetota bacterium]